MFYLNIKHLILYKKTFILKNIIIWRLLLKCYKTFPKNLKNVIEKKISNILSKNDLKKSYKKVLKKNKQTIYSYALAC